MVLRANTLLCDAIKAMTMDDVRAIYNGPEDMIPIVQDQMGKAGAIQS